ncbi:hypothetical protein Alsa1_CDS0185 [Staphylococcus phage Alsa_1]|nr:hypothetical protein Alsa1_CDS0185 [Staphylococcus phage Alsa_1]
MNNRFKYLYFRYFLIYYSRNNNNIGVCIV